MKLIAAIVIASLITLTGATAHAQRTWIINQCQSTPSDILDGRNHFTLSRVPYDTNCASPRTVEESNVLEDFGASGFTYSYDPNWNDCTLNLNADPFFYDQMQFAGQEWYGYSYVGKWDVTVWWEGAIGSWGEQNCWESFEELVWP